MRLLLFGNAGSGKSTLARATAARHGLAHLDLDRIVWEPGRVAVVRPMEAVVGDLDHFLEREARWVIEGCYGELVERASSRCTALVLLDPGAEVCLAHCRARAWEPEKYASPEAQDAMLPALLDWVRAYYVRDDPWSYAEHRRVYEAFAGTKRRVLAPLPPGAEP